MGNTSTSLHLLQPAADRRVIDREIEAAYRQLGYAPARLQSEPQKRVVVAEHGGEGAGAFLSIHDSGNALIDSGELKQLAVALSRKLKTAVVLTSIYDSDRFEFIVFNKGKQVDAVVSDPDDHAAGLKMLKAGKRQSTWKDIFLAPAVYRAMTAADAPVDATARLAAMIERERAFEQRMQRVGKVESAFAEDELGACCEAAGLDVANVLARDPTEEGRARNATVLAFAGLAAPDPTAPAHGAVRGIQLAPFISDDDWTAPRYFPAVWPLAEGQPARVRWLVTSSGAGFSGLKLRIELPDAPPTLTGTLGVEALPFYNGQVTTANAVASVVLPAPPVSGGSWTFDMAPFAIPDMDPQTRRQIVLVIVLELGGIGADAITLRPTLATTVPATVELALPPARVRLRKPTWLPRAADVAATATASSVLLLNEPTVLSMSAMIDETPAALRQARTWAEAWLSALPAADSAALSIGTMKHMSASFRVARSERTVALSGATTDRLWPKLFDPKSDYQTVMLRIMRDGAAFAVAGFGMQGALRDGSQPAAGQAMLHARATIEPFLRAGDHAHPLENEAGSALCISAWVLNDPAIFEALGTTPDRLAQVFDGWMAGNPPIQAWITRAAWIPEFDVYDDYRQTPYEIASTVDWFRSGLNGLLARRAWACRRLRFLAPTMWLGRELAGRVDLRRLATVAELSPCGPAMRVAVRSPHGLGDLEAALAPILPARSEA